VARDRGFAVAWDHSRDHGRIGEVVLRLLDERGRPSGGARHVDRLYGDTDPDLAFNPRTRELLVAYSGANTLAEDDDLVHRVCGRRLAPEGRWRDARRIALAPGRRGDVEQRDVRVAAGPGTGWIVAWRGRNTLVSTSIGVSEVFAAAWRPAP
jgi:hypothetical protein